MKIDTNAENLKNYKKYLRIQEKVEIFLKKQSYLKTDLPILSPALIPESYMEVFETEHRFLDKSQKLYLAPTPELFMKRLLAYGVGSCYYLSKSFRNGELPSDLHSPEFVILEYYKVGADHMDIAEELLKMLQYIAKGKKIKYQGKKISLSKWEKITVAEAFKKYSGINEKELFDHKLFINKAREKGYVVYNSSSERSESRSSRQARTIIYSYEDLWSQIYSQEVEPNLGINGYPTLIYDYPKEFAVCAKSNPDKKTVQRFEFYIEGVELGDCYTELTDWKEQKKRMNEEQLKRKKLKKIAHPVDKGFIETLKYGLPECAGIAIGFERLAMIFTDTDSINKLRLINISN